MANNTGTWLAEQLMRDFGLSPGAASGFAGNLAHESGNFKTLQEINPTVKGSRGGFGWAQWTGPRRRQFEAFTQQNGLDPTSAEANYGFLKHELSNTPERSVIGALSGVTDPSDAARIVSNKFLRPGIPHMSSRINNANSISSQIAANQTQAAPQAPGTPAPALPAPINVNDRSVAQMGSMSPQPQGSVPDSIIAAANPQPQTDKMGAMFAAMMQPPEQPQPQPVQFRGPSQEQANALSSFIAALRQRMA